MPRASDSPARSLRRVVSAGGYTLRGNAPTRRSVRGGVDAVPRPSPPDPTPPEVTPLDDQIPCGRALFHLRPARPRGVRVAGPFRRSAPGGRATRFRGDLAHSVSRDPADHGGAGRGGAVADRLGEDRRLLHPGDREGGAGHRPHAGVDPRAHPGAFHPGGRRGAQARRLQEGSAVGADLRRGSLRTAVRRAEAGSAHRRGHAGPAGGSHCPRHARPVGREASRARRGRPDARHGISGGHREDPRRGSAGTADGVFLGHHLTSDPGARAGTLPRPQDRTDRAEGGGRASAGGPGLLRGAAPREVRRPGAACRLLRCEERRDLLQHATDGGGAHRQTRSPWLLGRTAPRRNGPGPADPGDERLQAGRLPVSRGDRRGSPRHRRQRPRARRQLRSALRRRGLRAPDRSHRTGGPQGQGGDARLWSGDLQTPVDRAVHANENPPRPCADVRGGGEPPV